LQYVRIIVRREDFCRAFFLLRPGPAHEPDSPGDVQIFASGEAKICHHIENKALMKTVISTQQDGAGFRNWFWSAVRLEKSGGFSPPLHGEKGAFGCGYAALRSLAANPSV
jgi:hypothetical protein